MKFYLTEESKEVVRKNYFKVIEKNFTVIDTVELIDLFRYVDKKKNIYKEFLLEQEITKKLLNAYQSKRFYALVYIVPKIDEDVINGLNKFFHEKEIFFTDIVLIDYSMKIGRKIYELFDKVI